MSISFSCANCGKPYVVDDRFAGRKATCRMCGTINPVPSAEYAGKSPGPALPPPPRARQGVIPDAGALPLADEGESPIDHSPVGTSPAGGGATYEGDDDSHGHGEIDIEGLEDPGTLELLDDAPPPPVRPKVTVMAPPLLAAPTPAALPAEAQRVKPLRAIPVQACPSCGEVLPDNSVLCTTCGYNLRTGQAVTTTVFAGDPDDPAGGRHAPNRALRSAALFLVVGGLTASILSVLSLATPALAPLSMIGPMVGALLCVVGAVIYLIDGAMPLAGLGGGATAFSLAVLFGLRAMMAAPSPKPVAIVPATAPVAVPVLGPKVERISPTQYSIRKPKPGENVIEYWRPVLKEADPGVRLVAVGQLAEVSDPWRAFAVDEIASRAEDEDPIVRRAVMKNLAMAATAQSRQAAIRGLDDADPEVAANALGALKAMKDDATIAPLAAHYAKLGGAVLDALAAFGPASKERVAEAYQQILAGPLDAAARGQVVGQIVKASPDAAVPLLMTYLTNADPAVRAMAMGYLAQAKHAPAIAPIVDRLRDDPESAGKALVAFGPMAETLLAERVQASKGDPKFRVALLGVLGRVATAQSLAAVQEASRDPDMTVALAAREVWRKIEPDGLSPVDEAVMDLEAAKPFAVRALATLKATAPVEARRADVAKRLWEAMMATREADVQNAACEALMTWADDAVKEQVIASIRPDVEEAKRGLAIKLAVHFKDKRAVRPLCESLGQGRNSDAVIAALVEFDSASEEYLIKLLTTNAGNRTQIIELLRDVGTRRCFRALTVIASDKGGSDEKTKKLAQETMLDINRRLNTAAYRAAAASRSTTPTPAGAAPAGAGGAGEGAATTPATTQPTTQPTTRLVRPTTRATGASLW